MKPPLLMPLLVLVLSQRHPLQINQYERKLTVPKNVYKANSNRNLNNCYLIKEYSMPIPLIIAGAAAVATAYGAKKTYDGYQDKSKADDIVSDAKSSYESQKIKFDLINEATAKKLEKLGEFELQISTEFNEFSLIASSLLEKINNDDKDLTISIPKYQLEKVKKLSISATEYLGTIAGASTGSAAAGFAVYGGVMAFAAASTGTPIAALSGVAAYNATMAAIGGGSLAAGGLGMAGGAMILGAATIAPILPIAGWAYANHAEKALENAREIRIKTETAIAKMQLAEPHLNEAQNYIGKIYHALNELHAVFNPYFLQLKNLDQYIKGCKAINVESDESKIREVAPVIENGFALASILTDVITTPLFKLKLDKNNEPILKDGIVQIQTDDNGIQELNKEKIDEVLKNQNFKNHN